MAQVCTLAIVIHGFHQFAAAAETAQEMLLSAQREVSVSGEWTGRPELVKAHVNDDNLSTIWAGPEHSRSGWVQIDLGAEANVSSVVLDERPYPRTRNFEVRAKVKGKWQVLSAGTTIGLNKKIRFASVNARFFRLVILDAVEVPVISEFKLFGPAGQKLPLLPATLQRRPLNVQANPYWEAPVNRDRHFDYYAKQAIQYGRMDAAKVPAVIPPFPGLDGGVTHWGNQNEQTWRDNRVNAMDFGSMISGVFRGGGKGIGRAVAVRLDNGFNAVFNLDTLMFELAWKEKEKGRLVSWSDVRVGLVNGMSTGSKQWATLGQAGKPTKTARFVGLHRVGERVVFEYEEDDKKQFRTADVRDGKVVESVHATLKDAGGSSASLRWPKRLTTRGVIGKGAPYAIDTLTIPYDNPWKALFFVAGIDFLSPTRTVICTIHGDVWLVDQSKTDLTELRWKRYAAGLHQPLGLKVVDGLIHVMCRDQLVALHDSNGDDEADFYECVSKAHVTSGNGHDYITGLERDNQGRWYFASGNQGICRLDSTGKKVDVLATGFRNPNGLGVSPDGSVVLTSVQEGTWTPASAVCDTSQGKYFGFGGPKGDAPGYTPPMLYLPRGTDNSSGGQTYINSDRWGPIQNQWIHYSYGAASHFLLLREVIDGKSQAAAIPLRGAFLSGAHRGRFSPYDGQLYVVGSQGWGSYGTQDGSLQRVRYTGGDYPYPIAYETRANGVLLTFATPRSKAISNTKRWFAQHWNYRYGPAYGSPEFSVSKPNVKGHDRLEIRSVHLLDGGKKVFIELPQLWPVNQLHLHFDGDSRVELFATLHHLGKPFTDFPDYTPIPKIKPSGDMRQPIGEVTLAACVACHHPTKQVVGPPLSVIRQRYAGNPEGIVAWAMNPTKKDPNLPPMPSFKFVGKEKLRQFADKILGTTSASHPAPIDPNKVRFNRDIRPIFSNTCWACHGPDANKRKAKLRLDVRTDAIADRDGFRTITPGDPSESEAWQLITASDPDEQMPPKDFHTQLSVREKALIKKWIEQGAEYETHWAFIPPKRPAVPSVPSVTLDESKYNAVDAFILARLKTEGIAPAKQAAARALIRRVTLDLTGLPPTPAEVSAFIDDYSPNAYETVVDRLLATKAHAEHMARQWLDVARYADTSGYQYDQIRHQWTWRDWVIHAFATNMRFDDFVIQQNAGDLLPNATDLTRLATGFHRNHPITIEGGVIDEEYRTEYVMDRVVTATTAWMGLTFTCARCHDHKYDPIDQKDFYSFYAFFNNVPERGLHGFHPMAKIASPLQQEHTKQAADAAAQFNAALKAQAQKLMQWEDQLRSLENQTWAIQKPAKTQSTAGATLTLLADQSILAGGKNPTADTYEVLLPASAKPVKSIRLEAIPHSSMVNDAAGRGFNGNFVLSEFEVEAASPQTPQVFVKMKIANATADYQQGGFPIAAAIDGAYGKQGWAVDGHIKREKRTADFVLAQRIPAGSIVRIRMHQTFGQTHQIGRFRLSVSAEADAKSVAAARTIALLKPADRSADQHTLLNRYLVGRFGDVKLNRLIEDMDRLAASTKTIPDTLILSEMPQPRPAFVLRRGEYDKPIKTRPVKADVPAVFGGLPDGLPRNRLGLAKWLVSRSNPLTARVTVNRFWDQLFGIGIVKTVEDFGSQGEFPTHPDLLDWLAVEFLESGWNVRHLLKTIVMSRTYQQDSRVTPEAIARDPDNRLLGRGPRFRLSAEAVRDSALAVSGLLDRTVGGPSVYPYHPSGLWLEINNRPGLSRAYPHGTDASQLYRRSMYTYWKRTVPPPSMATFDAPGREFCVVKRSRTNTPLQAFVLLHDPQFVEAARQLAGRMITIAPDTDSRLRHGFMLCTSREPSAAELKELKAAFKECLTQYRKDRKAALRLLSVGASARNESIDVSEHAAFAVVARMLLNLSEFVTKG